MIVVLTTILLFIIIKLIKSNNNVFHPVKAYPYFLLIYVIPYIILYLIKGKDILEPESYYIVGSNMDGLMMYFILIVIISSLFYFLGVKLGTRDIKFEQKPVVKQIAKSKIRSIALLFSVISIVLFFVYYNSLGGLSFYLDNLAYRSELTKGAGYLFSLLNFFLFFSSALWILVVKYKLAKPNWLKLVFIISILMLIVSGSRSVVIRYIVIMSIVAYFVYQPTLKQLFSLKNKTTAALLLLLILIYVTIIPIIRTSTLEGSGINLSESFEESKEELETIAKGNIYVEIQLNILKLFEKNEHWYGQSYLDILYIPIPRSILPNKPSADDGLYIFNMVKGNKVVVGDSFFSNDEFFVQSWPPSTFGAGYANFGIFGVMLIYFLLGYLIALFYKKMIHSNLQFIFVFLYAYVFWRLQLSNLLIVEVLTIILILFLLSIVLPRIKKMYV